MSATEAAAKPTLVAIGRDTMGQPRTYRLMANKRQAAYQRLVAAILGLDVVSLTAELRLAGRIANAATMSR